MRFAKLIPWPLTDQRIVALTIYGEARGEDLLTQYVVAGIILNRWELKLRNRAFRPAESIGDICLWPVQFSCWNKNNPNRKEIERAVALNLSSHEDRVLKQCYWIAEGTIRKVWVDNIHGATHYHHYREGHPLWPSWATPDREVLGDFGKTRVYRLFR